MTLLQLLTELGGAELRGRWTDACLSVALVGLRGGRQLLLVERSYREGIRMLFDPTEEELRGAREENLWEVWNSKRGEDLDGAV